MIGPFPQQLGTFTTNAANGTPSGATAGSFTQAARFVNVWYDLTGGTSCTTRIWLFRHTVQWVLYTDIPTTTILTANGGGLLQIETRGAERVYVEIVAVTGPPTIAVYIDGVNY